MNPLVIIVGPTAVGKTALGVDLARTINGEIISVDSVQVYKYLNIGSAKPTIAEQQNVPHHLIDFLEPDQLYSAAQFQNEANSLINNVRERNHIPIVLGGTGLYARSLLDPYDFSEYSPGHLRKKWTDFLRKNGKEALFEKLTKLDPLSAERLHINDTVRVIRALEVFELTGKTLSSQRQPENNYQPLDNSIIYIGLTAPREILYKRINLRCEQMISEGLLEETQQILQKGYSPKLKPMRSIGYRHAVWYLYGFVTLNEMLRLLKRDTRHFAKRQLTWFLRDPRITWYDITQISNENIVEELSLTCEAIKTRVE
ncbi:MAG: tRNA (adenosine(37)-N6)-dimethylallyltransferase MiaA [Desulfitobacteriaceae bacterium]|nr:tRNA (adenosine(37)-N6)-dimethylallyltransferase MiaA [Desulfitobacteriaceae bacterium]MDD4346271.1 tRNA (adenosine(37)-N6)-dimethylallyltransferase MiaA [Desulfitobacteriaceae bacterium]MDD4400606.1 tRNA (adenosine(37)-N6)-dimethylallyltransferase MiaA [Desulfitobacteriaceae bacterium]